MRLKVKILFIFLFVFCLSCQTANSQLEVPNAGFDTKNARKNLIKTFTNKKYGLSLLFLKNSNDKFPFLLDVKLRLDKTGKTADLYTSVLEKEAIEDDAVNYWSPNEELFILHGTKLSIIKSKEILKFFSNPNFEKVDFSKTIKNIDEISVLTDKKNPEFRHHFEKWQDKDSFIFSLSQLNVADLSKTKEKFVEFRYDFTKKNLYRRLNSSDKASSVKFSGIIGKNKKGFIKINEMKDEPDN